MQCERSAGVRQWYRAVVFPEWRCAAVAAGKEAVVVW